MNMRTVLAAAALATVLGLATSRTVSAQARPRAVPPPMLTVSGQGTISRMPDLATVDLAIVSNDESATRAVSQNNTIYEALKQRMLALGVAESKIKTVYYNVNHIEPPPEPMAMGVAQPARPIPGPPYYQQRPGYVVTRNLAITLPRTDLAGRAIDDAVSVGVTAVNGVSYGFANPRSGYNAALAAAVADATAQAHAMADAAHVRLMRIVSIQSGYGGGPYPVMMQAARRADAAPNPPTVIPPSAIEVQATVTISYAIAPR